LSGDAEGPSQRRRRQVTAHSARQPTLIAEVGPAGRRLINDTRAMRYPDRGGARFAAFRARCAALIATALVVSGLTAGSASRSAAASATARAGAPPYRFLYDSDSAPAKVASYGWNLIDVGSRWSADQLQRGAKGLVWVGDYDNSNCAWEVSNPTLTKEVKAAVRDAKVFGYFISDEPNPYACPNAPAQHKARSDLIHSIDPAKPTVIVLDSNGFKGLFTRSGKAPPTTSVSTRTPVARAPAATSPGSTRRSRRRTPPASTTGASCRPSTTPLGAGRPRTSCRTCSTNGARPSRRAT